MEKHLGKIKNVYMGHGGYQGCQFGITFELSFGSYRSSEFWGFWGSDIEVTKNTKWSEQDRIKNLGEMSMRVSNLLKQAKVSDVHDLKEKPIEVIGDGLKMESWRLLTEVL